MSVSITAVEAAPSDCPLLDPLHISIEFETTQPAMNAVWRFSYVVDVISKNLSVDLGVLEETSTYPPGKHRVDKDFDLEAALKGVAQKDLNNVSLIKATLQSADNILYEERIVVQVIHGYSLEDGLKRNLYPSTTISETSTSADK